MWSLLGQIVKISDAVATVAHPIKSIRQKAVTGSFSSRELKKRSMMNKTTAAIVFAALYHLNALLGFSSARPQYPNTKQMLIIPPTPIAMSGSIILTSFRKVSPKPGATLRSKIDFEQKVNIYISIYELSVKCRGKLQEAIAARFTRYSPR